MNIKHILPILATVCLSCISGARPPESGEHGGSLTLIPLKRSVAELVGRHYPGATTHTFGDKVGFERSTRVFVSEAIVKLPKGKRPPLEEVRGPVEGGVWGELRHVEGAMHKRPPYPRAEGAIQRRGFVEHTFYQDYASQPHGAPACHLVVTLRLPGDTTEKEKKFIKDLRGLLSSFKWQGPQTAVHDGARIDPSTSGPVHPNTREAATKALEKIGGNAPEGLRVHPAAPQKGTKVDPTTSGPVHPNTKEDATKALEKIGANAPEGLRVHPANPKKGTKVDPSTSGPVHRNTEEAAKKALKAAGGDAPEGPKVSPADPSRHNGLEIEANAGDELAAGKTVKVTVTLKNHNKAPMQTFAPPQSMCNVVWKLRFDPPLHDEMGGNHTMFPSVTYDKVATIQPGKQVEFTFELTRKKNKIFVESECGKFGCLSKPVRIPKGTKELKLFYLHEDSGSDLYARAGDDEHIKFTEKRWSGSIRTQPVVIKLP